MRIERLKLFQFRNLADSEINFGPGVNFIVGRNAQGKTNLVEAIHLLATARSFRTAAIDEVSRWGTSACSIFAQVTAEPKKDKLHTYSLGISIDGATRAAFLEDERLSPLSNLLGKLLVVTFSPTDIALVKGAPGVRRKFFDKHLVDCFPAIGPALFEAHHATRVKSKLLKDKSVDQAALDVCDQLLARHSVSINVARKDFFRRVELRARLCAESISGQDGALSIDFQPSIGECGSAEEVLERLTQLRSREIRQRSCLLGPHRDEISFLLGGREARSFASQGQSRSIVLALKLAMVGLIEEFRDDLPILILDDFESELDAFRTTALLEEVRKTGRQVFVTGVSSPHRQLAGERPVRCFEVSQGVVSTTDS